MLGLALAGGMVLLHARARAETPVETRIAPPPTLKPHLPARRPAAQSPEEEEPPAPPPQLRSTDGTEDDPEATEDGTPVVPAAASGGDMRSRAEAEAPRDGVIEVETAPPPADAAGDLHRDARTPQEIAAFEGAPAGYNPYLFQIEPEPLADRRTAELFHLEPYTAVGVRIGSFVLFPEAEVAAVANNNVFRSPSPRADSALEVRSAARLVSDWRTHAVELRASGLASFYQEFQTEDDRAYTLEARGRLDLAKRTNIEALVSNQMDRAVRSTRDFPTDAAKRGDIETNRAAAAFNHRFNRLSLQLRGAIADVDYAPVPAIGGGMISNAERNFTQRDAALRTSWTVSQKADVFAETAVVEREYYAAPADGILRSSHGERYRLGVSFGPWDATIRGEVSAGWGRQRPDDARLGEIEGFIVDANLAWRATALTTFLLTASSDFVDTTSTGSAGGLSRQVGLEARHAFRRHLIGIAGIRYLVTPYEGIDVEERTLTGELGFDYYLGRDVIVSGRLQHIAYETNPAASDYTAEIVRIGMRVRQ